MLNEILKPTHVIYYTIPSLDCGEMTGFSVPLPCLTAESVLCALTMYDAQLAGVESAGFDMLAFHNDGLEAAFIIRTRGLGPTAEQNVLGHGHVTCLIR
jgi:hypothetical protein